MSKHYRNVVATVQIEIPLTSSALPSRLSWETGVQQVMDRAYPGATVKVLNLQADEVEMVESVKRVAI